MEHSELKYNASEHDDLFSVPSPENVAEQWLSHEFVMPQNARLQALSEDPQMMLEGLQGQVESNGPATTVDSHLLKLYSTLWETYSAKKAHMKQVESENEALRATNIHLCQERVCLQHRLASQEAMLIYFGEAFEKVRRGILSVFQDWETGSSEFSPEGCSAQGNGEDTQLAQ